MAVLAESAYGEKLKIKSLSIFLSTLNIGVSISTDSDQSFILNPIKK